MHNRYENKLICVKLEKRKKSPLFIQKSAKRTLTCTFAVVDNF